MAHRDLYLAAYDIASPRRLAQALQLLKGYASGGQKSVFECFLTSTERSHLLRDIVLILDLDEDRFLLLPLATGQPIETLGIAIAPEDPEFYYVG